MVSSTDSNALRAATVTVYKKSDSALIGYQITKERGAFEIKSLPSLVLTAHQAVSTVVVVAPLFFWIQRHSFRAVNIQAHQKKIQ